MHLYLGDFAPFFIQCNRGRSLDAFFDDFLLQPDSVKIALIGCGCSVATEPVAEIRHKWNVSQVLHVHTFILISQKEMQSIFFFCISVLSMAFSSN